MGTGRRDAAPGRRPSVPARGEHLAGNDRPLAGADGRACGRHVLRRPVPAHPRVGRPQDRRAPVSFWHDARLMNSLANALLGATLLAVIGSGLWWLSQRPYFAIRNVTIEAAD